MAPIAFEKFTPDEVALIQRLDTEHLPRHIAVIMDGNGRWATQQGLPRIFGHRAGVESIRVAANACRWLGISYLTLYSFSTENWTRPESEVGALMSLIEEQFRLEVDDLDRQGVRILHLGRLEGLPSSLQQTLHDIVSRTEKNTALNLVFAINYSGRAELVDAARRLTAAAIAGTLDPETLDEHTLANALYLPEMPDPDLLIRTGGEMRVSNYLLWEVAYSEFWSTHVLWPDFRTPHLLAAIDDYQHRQRKFGGVST